jgi:hypothetical protein
MGLTTFAADLAKQTRICDDVTKHIWHANVSPLITPEIIAEHKCNPLGHHSVALDIVLTFLRRDPLWQLPRLVAVALKPEQGWGIGEYPRQRAMPMRLRHVIYNSVAEIEHAIFLERLRAVKAAVS